MGGIGEKEETLSGSNSSITGRFGRDGSQVLCLWTLVPVCLPPSLRKLSREALPGPQGVEQREEACPAGQ